MGGVLKGVNRDPLKGVQRENETIKKQVWLKIWLKVLTGSGPHSEA